MLNTKHFFALRGGFNEDAKTESAQQAINKLNSLKMFFDQFPSMLVTDAATVRLQFCVYESHLLPTR